MENVNKKIKLAITILLVVVALGCSNSEEERNSVPSVFTVTVSNILETSAELKWTESTDPEESTVFYDVYLNSKKIADNITDLNFSLNDLEEGVLYTGNIVASDPEGNETNIAFNFETSVNQPPTTFNVTVVTKDPLFSRINWTESQDPEGGKIVYNVNLNGELVKEGIVNLYFFFQNLKGITSYSGYVEAIDPGGKIFKSNFKFFTEPKVYDRDIRLENQSQVEEFGNSGYNKIDGNLIIGSTNSNLTDVSDLSSLVTLQSIAGDIFYINNTICKNLKGLENIQQLSRYVKLHITGNEELLTLEGLEGITEVGNLYIGENRKLLDFKGLDNLRTVTGYFNFPYNQSLASIQALKSLTSVRQLSIGNNDALEDLKGLEKLQYINEFSITSNDGLKNLQGLNNLEECGSLSISDNTVIPNLKGLDNLNTVNSFYLSGNSQMIDLSGLENLVRITKSITIQFHEKLETMDGINNMNFIGGDSYGYALGIHENDKITNLDALINLRFVGQKGSFSISSNDELVDFCGLVPLTQDLDASSMNTNVIIRWNKHNPTYEQMLNGECSP